MRIFIRYGENMIGVFDSGLGGLTAIRSLEQLLPNEKIIYFGDTGRVPYGTRTRDTVIKYAMQDMRFLSSHNVDAVLIACGTVSSTAIEKIRDTFKIPVFGVVEPSAERAVKMTKNKIIGVIGTGVTVSSGSFENAIHSIDPDVKVISRACPLFVPLVENGFVNRDNEITRLTAEYYLKEIRESGADTLILGCTHFPIIADIISDVLPGIELVNSGEEAAYAVKRSLRSLGLLKCEGEGVDFYVSENSGNFGRIAEMFLGHSVRGNVTSIDIEKY
jgi:glutamate racemase